MTSLDELLRGRVAYLAMRSIARDLTVQLRSNGKPVPSWALPVLRALEVAAGEVLPPSVASAIGRPVESVEVASWVSIKEAAVAVSRSERQVRRLASTGRVRARRVGDRTWQVDLESLTGVLGRAA